MRNESTKFGGISTFCPNLTSRILPGPDSKLWSTVETP